MASTRELIEEWITENLVGARKRAAHAALKRLILKHGRLTPPLVLEAARSPRSALHVIFEWNDGVAAEKYRLEQARALIRAVKVVITAPNHEPQEVRAYVSPSPGSGYYAVAQVLSEAEMRAQMLNQALADMRSFQRKYTAFQELSTVIEAMEGALSNIGGKKKKKKKKKKTA